MNSPRLYDLAVTFSGMLAPPETDDGELSQDWLAEIEQREFALAAKVEACCRVMRNYEGAADMYAAEIERLQRKKAVAAGNAARLKEYVRRCLELAGVEKIEAGVFKLRFQLSPPAVQVADNDPAVMNQLLTEGFAKVSIVADKRAMLDAHKAGVELPKGVTVTQGRSLRIS